MIYTADEVKNMIAKEAERWCMAFLPGHKSSNTEWRSSDILGSKPKGKSFVVTLAGEKAGLWYENGNNAGFEGRHAGHIIDIIMARNGIGFREAIEFSKKWLGVHDDDVWKKSKAPSGGRKISTSELIPICEDSKVADYLVHERGISIGTLRKYGVCETRRWFRDVQGKLDCMAYPVYKDGEVANIKYIAVQRTPEGGKYIQQHPDGENHLIFMNRIPKDSRYVIICEGEIDALTLADFGLPAVSVPAGAHKNKTDGGIHKNNEWVQNDYQWLSSFETIILCFDNDDAGKSAAKDLFYRLGIARTKLIEIPEIQGDPKIKDPNSYARYCAEQGMDVAAEIQKLIDSAAALDPESLKHAMKYSKAIYDIMFPPDGKIPGYEMPNCRFGEHFRLRTSEVTIVFGHNGHGKSEFLNDLVVCLCAEYGLKAVIGSFEILPAQTGYSMWRQCTGMRRPIDYDENGNKFEIPGLFLAGMKFLDDHVMFYDFQGQANSKMVLQAYELAARMYGAKIFVIDSLTRMDIAEDDFQGQKDFMNALADFALKFDVHVFLVCHSKKFNEKRRESKNQPEKEDIAGSKKISDLCWNILSVWRNISKYPRLQMAQEKMDCARTADGEVSAKKEIDSILAENDTTISVLKQRFGTGELPMKRLWFDGESKQFRNTIDEPVRHYVEVKGVQA